MALQQHNQPVMPRQLAVIQRILHKIYQVTVIKFDEYAIIKSVEIIVAAVKFPLNILLRQIILKLYFYIDS